MNRIHQNLVITPQHKALIILSLAKSFGKEIRIAFLLRKELRREFLEPDEPLPATIYAMPSAVLSSKFDELLSSWRYQHQKSSVPEHERRKLHEMVNE